MSDTAPSPSEHEVAIPQTKVYLAFPSSGQVSDEWRRALDDLKDTDRLQGWRHFRGELIVGSGVNVSKARNELVERFLDQTDGEWLWFMDPDMVVRPDTLCRLLCAAEVAKAKVMGALCVMLSADGPIPTLYVLGNLANGEITRALFDYPDEPTVQQVAATGAGCVLFHRDVLEAVRENERTKAAWLRDHVDDPTVREMLALDLVHEPTEKFGWFQERVRNGCWVSEDLNATLSVSPLISPQLGFDVFVDCTTPVGHYKGGRVWWPEDIKAGKGQPEPRTYVIVPVKDRVDMTRALLGALQRQGQVDAVVFLDNGSNDDTKRWFAEVTEGACEACYVPAATPDPKCPACSGTGRTPIPVHVIDMPGAGIHEMWNAGVRWVLDQPQRKNVNVAILNNDLRIGPDFLGGLVRALRSDQNLVAVCPNYDYRDGEGLQIVEDICANRYDGTGGLAGFAFMVRGEWFQSGYLFPEECRWWYGDNDLVTAAQYAGGKVGIALDVDVEHIDGGGKTAGDWSSFGSVLDDDRKAFEERWRRILEDGTRAA